MLQILAMCKTKEKLDFFSLNVIANYKIVDSGFSCATLMRHKESLN